MSSLTVQNIQGSASSSNTISVASGHKISGAAGSIVAPGAVIQFQHVNFTNNITVSSSTFTDITGGTLTITPKFASSKILGITRATLRKKVAKHKIFIQKSFSEK